MITKSAKAQAPASDPTTMPAIAPPDTLEEEDGEAVDGTARAPADCDGEADGSMVALDPIGRRAAERIA